MKTALGAFAAVLLTGTVYLQPAHAQVQVQPAPGFSVEIGPNLLAKSRLADEVQTEPI